MDLNNIEFLLDDTLLDASESLELESYIKLPMEKHDITKVNSGVDRVSSIQKKKEQPTVLSMRKQRDAANVRERNRMHQLTRFRKTNNLFDSH